SRIALDGNRVSPDDLGWSRKGREGGIRSRARLSDLPRGASSQGGISGAGTYVSPAVVEQYVEGRRSTIFGRGICVSSRPATLASLPRNKRRSACLLHKANSTCTRGGLVRAEFL